jgi:hypothetical protein
MQLKAKTSSSPIDVEEIGRCGPENVSDSFDRVYQSLPSRLQSEFPKDKESFFVGLQALTLCRLQSKTSHAIDFSLGLVDAFDACWRINPGPNGKALPQVVIQQDAGVLHRNLIPMTVAAFAEFYVDDLFGPAFDQTRIEGKKLRPDEEQLAQFIADFRRARQLLAQALVDDYRAAEAGATLSVWAERFHTSAEALGDSKAFQNFVLSGLAGAYYCNADSADQFNSNELVRVRSAFLGMADFLGKPWYAMDAKDRQPL